MVLALVGAFAFADGPTMAWKTNVYSGFGVATAGTVTTLQGYDYSWVGAGAVRFNMNYTSADGKAGFNSRLQMTMPDASVAEGAFGGPTANFNQINAWAKFGMFTVRAGMNDDYTIATPIWNNYGSTDGKVGIYFNVTPFDGLDVGYFQPIGNVASDISNFFSPAGTARATVGLAYTAKDIAKIELGALAADWSPSVPTTLYAGAALTAVKGLTAQLEGKFDLGTTTSVALLENIAYNMGALTVGSYVGENLSGSNFYWGLEPTVAYKVTDNFSVNAIFNFYNNPSQTWMSPIDAGIGIAGGYGNDFNLGAGLSVGYSASGATLTVGDYFAGASGGTNLFYVNLDLAL